MDELVRLEIWSGDSEGPNCAVSTHGEYVEWSPALQAAWDLAQAVEWCYQQEAQVTRYPPCVVPNDFGYSWGIAWNGLGAGGHTLPEAVAALRQKMEAKK